MDILVLSDGLRVLSREVQDPEDRRCGLRASRNGRAERCPRLARSCW